MDTENCVIEIVGEGEGEGEGEGQTSIPIDSFMSNDVMNSQQLNETNAQDTTGLHPSIFYVPDMVKLVPIGPYHSPDFRKNALISLRTKWICAEILVSVFGLNRLACLTKIEEMEARVCSYYADQHMDAIFSGEVFNELFFLDSCFIWFFIYMVGCGFRSGTKIVGANFEKLIVLQSDLGQQLLSDITSNENQIKVELLMLGNQIPWFLIEIISGSMDNIGMNPLVSTLICFENVYPRIHKYGDDFRSILTDFQFPIEGFQHLLHIYHWSLVPKNRDSNHWWNKMNLLSVHKIARNAFNRFLRPIKRTRFNCFPQRMKGTHSSNSFREDHSIFPTNSNDNESIDLLKLETSLCVPNAIELHESSTSFNRLQGSFDIIFHVSMIWPSSRLQISALHIFDYSSSMFKNLINFEQKYKRCGYHITGYMTRIARLLQTKEDVNLLRKNNILPNTMKKDTEILDFLQQMRVETRGARVPGDLKTFYKKVTTFHGGKFNRAYGGFKHHYCPNPWVTLSVFGGVSLFILTLLQTIYTILGYKKS